MTKNSEGAIDVHIELQDRCVVHWQLGPELLVINVDTLRLRLREYSHAVSARSQWVAPAGILVTLVGILMTADFQPMLAVGDDFWRGLFRFCGLGTYMAFDCAQEFAQGAGEE